MSESIFRKKSLDRVSSPEELNAYIRVSNPGIWMLLVAILLLLVGVCVWGVLGHLDTTIPVAVVSENSTQTAYVREADISSVQEGMTVTVDDAQYVVTAIAGQPQKVDDSFSEYTLHLGNLQQGEWVFAVTIDGDLPEGVHSAEIIVESVSPMSFILN